MSENQAPAQIQDVIKQGKLAIEGSDEKLTVAFKVPNRALNNTALEFAKVHMSRGEQAALTEAAYNQLRVCLVRIGDDPVGYGNLEGSKIDKYLSPKQQRTLLDVFMHLTTSTEGEVSAALDTLTPVYDSEGHKRRVDLATGKGWIKDAEGKEVLDTIPVVFEVPSRKTIARASEIARQFDRRGELVVSSETKLNIVRLCVRQKGDRKLDYNDLRGDAIDAVFTQKQQSALYQIMSDAMSSSAGDREDFLSSLVDG